MFLPVLRYARFTPINPHMSRPAARFSTISVLSKTAMPPRPMWLIKEEELEEKFIKGGGPGGQKVNKSNSKVQLTHLPTGIVVNSQYSRSQEQNRKRARQILALKLEQMQNPENSRLSAVADRKKRQKENRAKKSAQKYRKLEKKAEIEPEEIEVYDVEQELDALFSNSKKV